MTLTEALTKLIIPPKFSIHFTIYQNERGEHRAKVEFKGGEIIYDIPIIKEILLENLPEAHYDWKVRNNTLYSTITNCNYPYRITTRITRA